MKQPEKVLFVDDDKTATSALIKAVLRRSPELKCLSAASAEEALSLAAKERPEAAIIDLALDPTIGPDSGFELIKKLIASDPSIRILVLTGHGSEEFGVRSLAYGAASFLIKPVLGEHLAALIKDAVSFSRLRRRYQELLDDTTGSRLFTGLRSRNKKMREVIEQAAFAASTNQPVLITGETGTGKGVLAGAIHRNSMRAERPFIRVQPAFVSQDLITSEIFGHQKGAFTGALENRRGLLEEANGGTLFIDEVDELPNDTQVLLLDVLQEKKFRRLGANREQTSDFRLITATNRALERLVERGKVREDFFHRIAHVLIEIPPLREREEDIIDLAEEFLRAAVSREKLQIQGFQKEAAAKLLSHKWPGNVRELQAVIESGVAYAHFYRRRFVEPGDLKLGRKPKQTGAEGDGFRSRIKLYEEHLVKEALAQNNNNQSKAAEALKLDRTSFRRIMARIS